MKSLKTLSTILVSLIVVLISYKFNLILPNNEFVNVETLEGSLRGFKSIARDGRSFSEFRGIPYARPPVGERRFEPPIRFPKWNGTRNALSYGSRCLQHDIFVELAMGDEDCLFLNVFTPMILREKGAALGRNNLLPVIVFIHGGIFMFGGSNEYGPHYFMDESVVLVTLNYRLASFGFLNTGDGVVQGNMGLKDQVLALEWIRDNIEQFGGDPNLVTITGESAGGASVHYHMLSTMSKGLFHRGISQSGTALNHWAFNPKPKEQAKRFGESLGCPTNSSLALVKCLKSLPADTINESHEENLLNPILHERLVIFAPTIETVTFQDSETRNFLTSSPLSIIESVGAVNKVPFINGVNAHEGLIYALGILKDSSVEAEINQDWLRWAPTLFDFEHIPDIQLQRNLSRQLKQFYLNDQSLGRHTLYDVVDLFSDVSFYEGLRKTTQLGFNKSMETYLYFNSHRGSFGLAQIYFHKSGFLPHLLDALYSIGTRWMSDVLFGWKENKFGTCHGDEIGLLYKVDLLSNIKRGDEEYSMSKAIVKAWTQFARDGYPSRFKGVNWPAAQLHENRALQYMLISNEPSLIDEPFSERLDFWNDLRRRVGQAVK